MPPKKKLVPPSRGTMASVIDRLRQGGLMVTTAEESSKDWRYLTFADPRTGLPSIAHEWLIGAAGFRAGTINQFRGLAGTGKSSLCMLEYASAIRNGGAYCAHIETEGSGMSNTRTAEMGLAPEDLMIPEDTSSFEAVVEFVDTIRCVIRGGLGGTVNDLGRKSATKFKMEDAEDPDKTKPILIGIDSLSNLGKEDDTQLDVSDMSKAKQPGWLPRQIKAWLRAKAKQYERDLLTMFLTSQETQKINTGGPASYLPPEKTSVAGDAIKFFDTVALDVSIKDWKDRAGVVAGREMMLKTFKSKLSGAAGRKVSFFLTKENGFDMIHADAEFLLSNKDSPFADGAGIFKGSRLCYRHAGGITCRPLGDKAFRTEEEFIRAFYDNKEVLDQARDGMRIMGYGLPHETKYKSANGVTPISNTGSEPSTSDDVEEEEEYDESGEDLGI